MPPRVPRATYRLQLNADFPFAKARDLVEYLDDLGVSDLYLSPIFAARPGSRHGYDVIDPTRLNPDLGEEEDFRGLVGDLLRRGMGLLLDIVPNHMAASEDNPWWWDLLASGRRSPYAGVFDIDWDSPRLGPGERGRIVLPLLGEPLSKALARGAIRLATDGGDLRMEYDGQRLPLAETSEALVVHAYADARSPPGGPQVRPMDAAAARAPPGSRTPSEGATQRPRLDPGSLVRWANARRRQPEGRRLFVRLLAAQHYALTEWRPSKTHRNYRRFFDIDDLVALRADSAEVFELTHRLTLHLARTRAISGVRIDHIDGLADPIGYLRRLKTALGGGGPGDRGGYTIVEKILVGSEGLPEAWPVHGTTGYDFSNAVNALFVDPRGLAALEEEWAEITGRDGSLEGTCLEAKREVLRTLFPSELEDLVDRLMDSGLAPTTDFTPSRAALRGALVELTAQLPVYRTYVRGARPSGGDLTIIRRALDRAWRSTKSNRRRRAIGLLRSALLRNWDVGERTKTAFFRRWQQLTGAAMAKGLEDTVFYRFNPLISLNEVGGDPARVSVHGGQGAFHRAMGIRRRRWPFTLNATSTHDTKRSEDVRARINVLSEIPGEFCRRVRRWREWNRTFRTRVRGQPVPDANEEWFLYQTLMGAWPPSREQVPAFRTRLRRYLVKAAREAKIHTTWLEPRPDHEAALGSFADVLVDGEGSGAFHDDFLAFQRRIAYAGAWNSLSQVVLKIASPGVPDFYQGNELWDLSLADPDNRRAVDFALRRRLLRALPKDPRNSASLASELLRHWPDGRIKLYVTHRGLRVRREKGSVLLEGEYISLRTQGPLRSHVCAFARRRRSRWVLAVAACRCGTLTDPSGLTPKELWGPTEVRVPDAAPRAWRDLLTDRRVRAERVAGRTILRIADVFECLPVALLVGIHSKRKDKDG